ncbi:hypothetical protein BC749_108164 [Flavobacterium araucananum]|uniref:DUF4348 domain-containing protein n=1 Tax=Flavobacterium araucananum TaxID=946678 RepID=A0A227NS38_9FLAO|nr:hypothetical protein [Flavobacterium araucananum]OXG00004.1 hypothetical protein B0A64_20815 [Flavobacterium araucananum]PWJ97014.1 hypothetical protein BC749_108164 [Flavobacterium araucananum]
MKKILYVFIISQFIFSCSASKDQNAPINDYISSLDLKDSDKIMLIQEKINNNVTIEIFKGNIYYEPYTNKYERNEGLNEPLYDKKDWEKMKTKYENNYIKDQWIKGDYWTLKDFKHQNIIFIKQEKFPNPGKYEKFDFQENYKVFSFSNVIYYKHKKYAVFTIKSTTTDYKNIDKSSVLILTKIGGKWTVFLDVGDGIYR